jgi:uncharacterized membrane protein
MELIDLLLSGGITGIIGTLLGRVAGYYENKQKFEHELALLDAQKAIKFKEAEHEFLIAQAQAVSDLRQKSYEHDTMVGAASRSVINILRLVRPILTIFAIILVALIWYDIEDGNIGLKEQIVGTVLYIATSSILWWFGDRAPTPSKNTIN